MIEFNVAFCAAIEQDIAAFGQFVDACQNCIALRDIDQAAHANTFFARVAHCNGFQFGADGLGHRIKFRLGDKNTSYCRALLTRFDGEFTHGFADQ